MAAIASLAVLAVALLVSAATFNVRGNFGKDGGGGGIDPPTTPYPVPPAIGIPYLPASSKSSTNQASSSPSSSDSDATEVGNLLGGTVTKTPSTSAEEASVQQGLAGVSDALNQRPGVSSQVRTAGPTEPSSPASTTTATGSAHSQTVAKESTTTASTQQPTVADPTVADPTVADPTVADPTDADPTDADPTVADPTDADPTVADPTVADPTDADPTVADPTVADPTNADPTVADPTVADPTVADPTVAEDAMPLLGMSSAIQGLRGDLELLGQSLVNASKKEELAIVGSLTAPLQNVEAKVDKLANISSGRLQRVESKLDSVLQLHTHVGSAVVTSSMSFMGQLNRLSTELSKDLENVQRDLSSVRKTINSSFNSRAVQSLAQENQALASRMADVVNQTNKIQSSIEDVGSTLRSTGDQIQTKMEEYVSSEMSQLRKELEIMKKNTSDEVNQLKQHFDDIMSTLLFSMSYARLSTKFDDKLEKSISATNERVGSLEELVNVSLGELATKTDEKAQEIKQELARMNSRIEHLSSEGYQRLERRTRATDKRLQSLEREMNSSLRGLSSRVGVLRKDMDDQKNETVSATNTHLQSVENLVNSSVRFFQSFAAEINQSLREANGGVVALEHRIEELTASVGDRLKETTSTVNDSLQSVEETLSSVTTSLERLAAEMSRRAQETNTGIRILSRGVEIFTRSLDERVARSTSRTSDRLQSLEQLLNSSVRSLREDAAEASRGVEQVSSRLGGLARRLENLTQDVDVLLSDDVSDNRTLTSRMGAAVEEGVSRVAGGVQQLLGKVDTALAAVGNLPRVLDAITSNQTSQIRRAVNTSRDDTLKALPWVGALRVRLVGPSESAGRLEIRHEGKWGTVCDDKFTDVAAAVVCRHLGFPSARARAHGGDKYGRGSDPIWLDEVICPPGAGSLVQCSHEGWGVHNCHHGEDVGVSCA